MNTILRKIAEFIGLKLPDQSGMERMIRIEQQGDPSNDMAAIPGKMAMVQVPLEERQKRGQEVNKRSYF